MDNQLEQRLEKLNNRLNRRRVDYIDISGKCSADGRIKQRFTEVMNYQRSEADGRDDESDYYVSLISAEFGSFFPNIIEGKNNNFYYKYDSESNLFDKIISFNTGSYEIEDLNKNIQQQMKIKNHDPEGIKIMVDSGSGRCKIFLKEHYEVSFLADNTFRDIHTWI